MKPDNDEMKELRGSLETIISLGTEVWQRQDRAQRVRFNVWPGQSEDGRKYDSAENGAVRPFNGCADSRVPLIDGIINDDVDLAKLAFFRGQVQAVAVESGDAGRAQNINTLLKWLRDSEMRDELETEVELAAQYLYGDDPGIVVLSTTWARDTMMKRLRVTFDDLAGMYATGAATPEEVDPAALEPELLGDFADLATNPVREREFLAWLTQLMPMAIPRAVTRAMRELRKTGETVLPIPQIRENRPRLKALKLFDEFFMPIGTVDLQRARDLHEREWLSETELRERVLTHLWDAEVVEEIIEKGKGQTIVNGQFLSRSATGMSISLSGAGRIVNEQDNLFEIWWSHSRRADDLGVAEIRCTIWNCAVERPLTDVPCDYPDGEYPYVYRTRERVGRQITDSRGTHVALATHQYEVKLQRDARSNFTSMAGSPPKKVKMSRGAWDLAIGPDAEIPVNRMDDFEWAPLPNQLPQASIEMERTTKAEADDYSGRMVEGVDANRVSTKMQAKVGNFLQLMRAAFRKLLVLCQHYYTATDLARVTGDDRSPASLTPEDVGGRFDVIIEIDARDLNMEFAMKKLEGFTKLKQLDVDGRLGTDGLIEWGANGIDPILARKSLRPLETVRAQELKDEQGNVAKMVLGIEPDMPTEGINAQNRLQVMMQTIQGSPKLTKIFQQDEGFRALVENRQKYLTQQIKQEKNKVIGAVGTAPLQQAGGDAMLALGGGQAA